MTALVLTTLAVIGVSAFCSLCEAVLYALPPTYIAQLEERGHPQAAALAELREHIDRPITAILTVNTVANTAGAAITGALAAKALGEGNVLLFSAGLTIAILLFSEIVPKTVGVVHTRALGPWLARPLTVMVVLLTPAIFAISRLTQLIAGDEEQRVSQEEIASLARLGSAEGVIDAGEAAVIQNILSLPKTPVHAIMTPRTVTFVLAAETSIAEAQGHERLMVHSRIPVYDESVDDIVGMVFRRDVLAAADPSQPVRKLIRPVEFVVESEAVDRTLDLLLAHKRHLLVVLGEFGEFAGVVTLEDVLEEILGEEIVDEFDEVADMRALARERRTAALARTHVD